LITQTEQTRQSICSQIQVFFPNFQGLCLDFRQIKTFGGASLCISSSYTTATFNRGETFLWCSAVCLSG